MAAVRQMLRFAALGLACLAAMGVIALWLQPSLAPGVAQGFVPGTRLGIDLAGGSALEVEVPAEVQDPAERERIAAATAVVLQRRLARAKGVSGARFELPGDGRIRILIPGGGERELREAEVLVTSQGTLEFRLAADAEVEIAEWERFEPILSLAPDHPRRRAYEAALERDRGLAWFPDAQADAKRSHRLIVLAEDGEPAPVFRGSDLASVGLVNVPELQPTFEFQEEAGRRFSDFTGRIRGRHLALIYDGKVVSDPVVRDRLPGRGVIEGLSPRPPAP